LSRRSNGLTGWTNNLKTKGAGLPSGTNWLGKKFKDGFFIGQSAFIPVGKRLRVYDFSLARNTIVVWTIQSCHWAKHLSSGWQVVRRIGTKQITSVYALSGNFFYYPFFDCK